MSGSSNTLIKVVWPEAFNFRPSRLLQRLLLPAIPSDAARELLKNEIGQFEASLLLVKTLARRGYH